MDEVGRGCLAGPVFAAAVILSSEAKIPGLRDSKKMTARDRQKVAVTIKDQALDWSIARAEASEIDRFNVLQASLLAMSRAVSQLKFEPDWVMVDGNRFPPIDLEGETVIGGDEKVPAISAASILAKVARDEEMCFLDSIYPEFEFNRHKGYPTRLHMEKLNHFGPSEIHRVSFIPVKKLLPKKIE